MQSQARDQLGKVCGTDSALDRLVRGTMNVVSCVGAGEGGWNDAQSPFVANRLG